MRFGIVLMVVLLAGCGSSIPDIPEGTHMSPDVFIARVSAGAQWCYSYDSTTGTCLAVMTLNRVTEGGVRLDVVSLAVPKIKVSSIARLYRKGNRLCRDDSSSDYADSVDFFRTADNKSEITSTDRSVKFSRNDKDRELFEKIQSDSRQRAEREGSETCFAYYVANQSGTGLEAEILMVKTIDGVQQPIDFTESRGAFFTEGSTLELRTSE